jgi:hypothetical protein
MLRAPLFFAEHIRRGRISLLTDAAVPSPPAPSGVRQAPRVSAGLFCFWKDGTPIQGKRSAPPPEPRPTEMHFLKCFGSWPGVAPPTAGAFFIANVDKSELQEGSHRVTCSNILFLVVGALAIVVVVMGYQLYQDRKQPDGMRIDLGPNGVKIEKK